MVKRFLKLATGSVVALHAVSCLALTNADGAQDFIRSQIGGVIDWAAFFFEQAAILETTLGGAI